jgi:hypothetical protein
MLADLSQSFADIAADRNVRAVVLAANGPAFSPATISRRSPSAAPTRTADVPSPKD